MSVAADSYVRPGLYPSDFEQFMIVIRALQGLFGVSNDHALYLKFEYFGAQ